MNFSIGNKTLNALLLGFLLSACGGGGETPATPADTAAPSLPSVSIDAGNASTNATVVSLDISATDNVGVSAYYASEIATTPAATDAGWAAVTPATNFTATVTFTLSSAALGNNTKTVYVWLKDAAGNVSVSANDDITLVVSDSVSPSVPAVAINAGAASSLSTAVTLDISATDAVGVTAYFASETAATPAANDAGWTAVTPAANYAATVNFTLSSGVVGNNSKTVYVWFKDAAGNMSAQASDAITLVVNDANTPASPAVSINTNAASTILTAVTLDISATDNVGVSAYYASEIAATPAATDAGWIDVTPATNYAATVNFTLSAGALGNNSKTVYVWFKDAAGNVSASASDAITLVVSDTVSPSAPAVAINAGAISTSSTAVTLDISATDNVGVSAYYASEISSTPAATDAGWTAVTPATNYTATVNFTLSAGALGNNSKTVFVWFKDAAGNVSAFANDAITLVVNDTASPSAPAVAINAGAISTSSTAVTLDISATDNVGVSAYFASETASTPAATDAGWSAVTPATNYAATVNFTLSAGAVGNNTRTVFVWFRDAAGNVSAVTSDVITLVVSDSASPATPAIAINTGAASTTSTAIMLDISATDNVGVTAFFTSETASTPAAADAGWSAVPPTTNYTATVNFTLSAGVVGNNTKTVYIWFKDAAGNVSVSANDAITLVVSDSVSPSVPTVAINTGAASTTSTAVTLNISATDNVGVSAFFASEIASTPAAADAGWTAVTPTTNYTATVNFTLSAGVVGNNTKTVYVWFKDAAGNVSVSANDAITLVISDTASPSAPTVAINTGAASTLSTSVTLDISATDNVGVSAYFASETAATPAATDAGWLAVTPATNYTATVNFTLSAGAVGNNTKTVYVWFKDAAGNVSASASDAITLVVSDAITPASPSISINAGAASSTSISVTLNISATDNVGVSAYYASEIATTPAAVDAGWTAVTPTTSYTATVNFTLSAGVVGNNTKTVYVWFKDAAGNVSASANDAITLVVSAATYTIGGTLSGLTGSITLNNNGGDPLTLTANGAFTFTTPLSSASPYAITVASATQNCAVTAAGSGTVSAANVTGVTVACGPGTFLGANGMSFGHLGHTATLLPNGQVLVVAGDDPIQVNAGGQAYGAVELYDPATGFWQGTNNLSNPVKGHTATLLSNGKVLITGGVTPELTNNVPPIPAYVLPNAELFTPATETWGLAAPMTTARYKHTATRLANGKVLVTGGLDAENWTGSVALASAELYDPAANSWAAAPPMNSGRAYHNATLLPNGKVLVVGGDMSVASTSAELYDPVTNTWAAAAPMAVARLSNSSITTTATLLADGRVLVSGTATSVVEIYNPVTNTWTAAAPRVQPSKISTLLPNGQVLMRGSTIATLYDPVANTWTSAGSGLPAYSNATATLLTNGRVLFCGGSVVAGVNSSAELYW